MAWLPGLEPSRPVSGSAVRDISKEPNLWRDVVHYGTIADQCVLFCLYRMNVGAMRVITVARSRMGLPV